MFNSLYQKQLIFSRFYDHLSKVQWHLEQPPKCVYVCVYLYQDIDNV